MNQLPQAAVSKCARSSAPLFIIGLDAEWQREGNRNRLLSFQAHVLFNGRSCELITYPENGERPHFARLIGAILAEAKSRGLFSHYPKNLTLVSHFSLAELSIMEDFLKLVPNFDSIRGSLTTVTRPVQLRLTDKNNNQRKVSVSLRDSSHLTPEGTKLAILGELHGIPKMELPPGSLENMAGLLKEDPELFEEYALRDAKIAAIHALKMAELNLDLTGRYEVPITLGSLAVAFTLQQWPVLGFDPNEVLGNEVVQEDEFNPESGRTKRSKRKVKCSSVHQYESFAGECYHGGRSESFLFGPTHLGTWSDLDLKGAYTTAMAAMGMPLWDKLFHTTNLSDFNLHSIGLAKVRFLFPQAVRFPCLPVRISDNLIFPLEGESYATAAEILLALDLGAAIEVLSGVVIPWDDTRHPFKEIIKDCTTRRQQAQTEGRQLEAKIFKEIGNSLYGKLGQGLRMKRRYDSRTDDHKKVPPSALTQAFLAAHVTGMIRAAMGEMLNRTTTTVISVTTDGFICEGEVDDARVEYLCGGPICSILRDTRKRIADDSTILEKKHIVSQVLSMRTRGQATLRASSGGSLILAKAGVKCPPGLSTPLGQNDWIIGQFFNRTPDSTSTCESLRPLIDIARKGGDLVTVTKTKRLNLDFDFKRAPAKAWTTHIDEERSHLTFETEPFRNVDQCLAFRECWDTFRKTRLLKTEEDLAAFEDYRAAAPVRKKGLHVPGGDLQQAAMNQFMRALVRGEWGMEHELEDISCAKAAALLSSTGIHVTRIDLKNAKRPSSKLVPYSIPRVTKVMKLVQKLGQLFPSFNADEMLEQESTEHATGSAIPERPRQLLEGRAKDEQRLKIYEKSEEHPTPPLIKTL